MKFAFIGKICYTGSAKGTKTNSNRSKFFIFIACPGNQGIFKELLVAMLIHIDTLVDSQKSLFSKSNLFYFKELLYSNKKLLLFILL